MLIKYEWRDSCQRYINKYEVKNEDIERMERMLKRKMPRKQKVHLYTRVWNTYYFPIVEKISKMAVPAIKWYNKWRERNDEIILRIEQEYITDELKDKRCWLIEMKTWAGKSLTIAKLIQNLWLKTLIATHSITCLKDMKKTINRALWVEAWEYSAKKKDIRDITVTTHKSLCDKFWDMSKLFDVVIIDECDRNLTDKMFAALNQIDVNYIYWFTWTPRTKELSLASMQMIFWPHIKYNESWNNWYQLLPDIRTFKYRNWLDYPYTDRHELKEMLINDWIRFRIQCWTIYNAFQNWYLKYWLLLVERKADECEWYYKFFKDNTDLPVIMINWDTKVEDDQEWIKMLKEKWKWLIVWTVWKVWRWADIPMIDWVFLFFPNRFESSTIQAVWRWLRKYEWKNKCILFDWCDDPVLRSQLNERKRTYKKEYWNRPTKDYIIDARIHYQKKSSWT